MRRLTILLAAMGALLLIPAAGAAAGTLTVNTAGDGSGTVSSVGGYEEGGEFEGNPAIDCTWNGTTEENSGDCVSELEEGPEVPGFEAIAINEVTAEPGSELVAFVVEEGEDLTGGFCEALEFNKDTLTCIPGVETGGGGAVVTAVFECEGTPPCPPPAPPIPLTVTKEGSGTVVSNPAGIECGETCSASFEEGKKVTLTASPSANSKFLSWKGCEKGGAIGHTCTVTMDKAKTVIAKFGPTQSLTLSKAGTGTGTVKSAPSGISCDGSCSSNVAAFTEGASVVLTATPTKYHTFTGWSGSGCEGTGTCTVTMSAAKSVTAEFAATKYALTLSKAGGGTGAVKSKPASLTCGATCSSVVSSFYAGTEVEVTATPSKGSTLNWSVGSGTCTGSTSPCFVTMSAAKSLTAEFK